MQLNEIKQTLKLSLPVAFAYTIEIFVHFINTVLITSFGANALAGMALAISAYNSFMGFYWGLMTSIAIIIAQKIGIKKNDKIDIYLKASNLISIICSLIIIIILLYFPSIWYICDQPSATIETARTILLGMIIGIIPDNLKFVLFQYCIGFKRPNIPLIVNITMIPAIYALNDALINGKYGLPALGILGVSIGTSCIYWLAFLMIYLLVRKENFFVKITSSVLNNVTIFKQAVIELVKLGLPISIIIMVEIAFFMAFTMIIGRMDKNALAAYQITSQYMLLFMTISYGFAEATSVLVGHSYGRKNEIKRSFTYCIVVSTIMLASGSIFFWCFPKTAITLITINNISVDLKIQHHAINFFIFVGLILIIDNIRITIAGVLRGINITKYTLYVSLTCFWVIGIPLCLTLTLTNLNENGAWIGLIIILGIATYLQYIKLKKTMTKNNFTVKIQ